MGCCCSSPPPEHKPSKGPNVIEVRLPPPAIPTPPITPIKPKIVIAVFSYDAIDDQDLSFSKGDRMQVQDDTDGDWLFVEHLKTGQKGYIPGNFVAAELSVESEDWFFENISRKEAEKLLLGDEVQPRGTFLIRPSEHNRHGYSLSVKDWETQRGYHVKHYKIKPLDNGGFYISTNKTYASLPALVMAYSENAYGLCHVLSRPCRRPKPPMWVLGPDYRGDKWEIPRHEIKLIEKLGRGNFGEVYYGKWKNQCEVAVKTLREGQMSKQAFLDEASIMKKFRHKRLVQLYGVVREDDRHHDILIVQEYLPMGSLKEYLPKYRDQLQLDDLFYIAQQVASGMAFLEHHAFIHRDLAARNVLMGPNNLAKIGDFGLARIVNETYYLDDEDSVPIQIPIRSTAIESLITKIFTVKSDVWSYGVLLWEMFTYGQRPFGNMGLAGIKNFLKAGYRLAKPRKVPDAVYDVMLSCWNRIPASRPTFLYLETFFASIEVQYTDEGHTKCVLVKKPNYEDLELNSPTESV